MITFGDISFTNEKTYSGRQLINVDIIYNGEIYKWKVYTPILNGDNLMNYLIANSGIYENDIIRKEQLWAVSPHTEVIYDDMSGEEYTVDIPKDRIVRATIPDYIEIISSPTMIASQMSSIWNDDEFEEMKVSINNLKYSYTDYENITLDTAREKKRQQILKVASEILWTYFIKKFKDVTLVSSEVLSLRDTKRLALKNQGQTMIAEINQLKTVDEIIQYKIIFS